MLGFFLESERAKLYGCGSDIFFVFYIFSIFNFRAWVTGADTNACFCCFRLVNCKDMSLLECFEACYIFEHCMVRFHTHEGCASLVKFLAVY